MFKREKCKSCSGAGYFINPPRLTEGCPDCNGLGYRCVQPKPDPTFTASRPCPVCLWPSRFGDRENMVAWRHARHTGKLEKTFTLAELKAALAKQAARFEKKLDVLRVFVPPDMLGVVMPGPVSHLPKLSAAAIWQDRPKLSIAAAIWEDSRNFVTLNPSDVVKIEERMSAARPPVSAAVKEAIADLAKGPDFVEPQNIAHYVCYECGEPTFEAYGCDECDGVSGDD